MGCFPDRTLPQYTPLTNQRQRLSRRSADPNKNIDTVYVPIDINESHITSKSITKMQRSSPKKAKAQPVNEDRQEAHNKFSRKQFSSVLKIDVDKQRKLTRKKNPNNRIGVQRNRGRVIQSPNKEHIITAVQTPSESAKTSILLNLQNNPSIFFVKMNEKDLDLVFNTPLSDKNDEKYHRLNYRSMSPLRIQKQPSA